MVKFTKYTFLLIFMISELLKSDQISSFKNKLLDTGVILNSLITTYNTYDSQVKILFFTKSASNELRIADGNSIFKISFSFINSFSNVMFYVSMQSNKYFIRICPRFETQIWDFSFNLSSSNLVYDYADTTINSTEKLNCLSAKNNLSMLVAIIGEKIVYSLDNSNKSSPFITLNDDETIIRMFAFYDVYLDEKVYLLSLSIRQELYILYIYADRAQTSPSNTYKFNSRNMKLYQNIDFSFESNFLIIFTWESGSNDFVYLISLSGANEGKIITTRTNIYNHHTIQNFQFHSSSKFYTLKYESSSDSFTGNIMFDIGYYTDTNFYITVSDGASFYPYLNYAGSVGKILVNNVDTGNLRLVECAYATDSGVCKMGCGNSKGIIKEEAVKGCYLCSNLRRPLYEDRCSSCVDGLTANSSSICEFNCKSEAVNIFYDDSQSKCVSSCPKGAAPLWYGNCYKCARFGLLYEDGKCVADCSSSKTNNYGFCINCKDIGQLNCFSNCCSTCPTNFGTISNGNDCMDCQSQGLMEMSGKCVSTCSIGYEVKNGNCSLCRSNTTNKYYLDVNDLSKGTCVSSCPENTEINSTNFICKQCSSYSLFYEDGNCVLQCKYCTDSNNICYVCNTCEKQGLFLDRNTNTCVSSCPEGSSIIGGKECALCSEQSIKSFYFNKKCLKTCPIGTIVSRGVCKECKYTKSTKFYLDVNDLSKGSCVARCPAYTEVDSINLICKKCSSYSQFYQNWKCVDKCSYCSDSNNICIFCNDCQFKGLLLDRNTNTCVSSCPQGSYVIEKNECALCSELTVKSFYFNKKCLNQCPDLYISDRNFKCVCAALQYENFCFDICPNGTGVSPVNKNLCIECITLGKYLFNQKCVDICPEGTIIDNTNHICSFNPFLADQCSDDCSKRGKCLEKNTNKCQCDDGYIGNFCEIQEKQIIEPNENLLIYTRDSLLISEVNIFHYQLKIKDKFVVLKNYTLQWEVKYPSLKIGNFSKEEYFWYLPDESYISGRSDDCIKIAPFSFQDGENIISLSIFDYSNFKFYNSSLKLEMRNFDRSRFNLSIHYYDSNIEVPYATGYVSMVYIKVEDFTEINSMSNNFKYKLFYANKDDQFLPVTAVYQSSPKFIGYLPVTNRIAVSIQDNRGQVTQISSQVNVRKQINTNEIEIENQINSIISKNNTVLNEKLLRINDHFNYINSSLSISTVISLTYFLKRSFEDIIKTENSTVSHSSLLAVYNHLVMNLINSISSNLNLVRNMNEVMLNFTKAIYSLKDPVQINRNDCNSYYKSLDLIFTCLTNSNLNKKIMSEQISTVKKSISYMNKFLTMSMIQGEQISIKGKNFLINIEKPSRQGEVINFEDEVTNDLIYPNSNFIKNKKIKSECTQNSYLCMDNKNYDNMKHHLLVSRMKLSDLAIIAVKLNNSLLYSNFTRSQKFSNFSVTISFYNYTNRSVSEKSDIFKYDINLSIQNSDLNYTSNSACISFPNLKNSDFTSCSTYYNYSLNKTICRCKGSVEVSCIYDPTLANYAKSFQFPEWSCNLLNPLSICIVFGSLMVLVSYSLFLLIYDMLQDKKDYFELLDDDHQYMEKELKLFNSLEETNLFSFATFMTMQLYPFVAIFSFYHYHEPRFLTFLILILRILMSLTLTLIPYYKTSFTYAEVFKDKRDINEAGLSIDNLPTKLIDVAAFFLYYFVSSLIIAIILFILSLFIKWNESIVKVCQSKKKIINRYIRQYYQAPGSLQSKWRRLRTNILALTFLMKRWINSKIGIKKKTSLSNKKVENNTNVYDKTSEKCLLSNTLFKLNDKYTDNDTSIISSFRNNKNPLNQNEEDIRILENKLVHEKDDSYFNDSCLKSSDKKSRQNTNFIMKKNLNNSFSNSGIGSRKPSYDLSPSVSLLISDKHVKLNFNYKIYDEICVSKVSNFSIIANEEKLTKCKKISYPTHTDLKKVTIRKEDLLIFNKKNQMRRIFNFTIDANKPNRLFMLNEKQENIKVIKIMIAFSIIIFLYVLFYLLLIILISDIFQRYRYYILKIWLLPSMINVFLISFFSSFIVNILKSSFLFKFYHFRKETGWRAKIFNWVINKDILSIFKLRVLMIKYKKELDLVFIKKSKQRLGQLKKVSPK